MFPVAHGFLIYSDQPDSADAVVLYVGPEFNERLKEALFLLNNGYAGRLIIPAYQKSYALADFAGNTFRIPGKPVLTRGNYPWFYENTHIETLEAKKMMIEAGVESAILVSSPYHMRRIKLIAASVFSEANINLKFVGSRFSKKRTGIGLYNWLKIRISFFEYLKILVFLTYRIF